VSLVEQAADVVYVCKRTARLCRHNGHSHDRAWWCQALRDDRRRLRLSLVAEVARL